MGTSRQWLGGSSAAGAAAHTSSPSPASGASVSPSHSATVAAIAAGGGSREASMNQGFRLEKGAAGAIGRDITPAASGNRGRE